jgi:DNA-binding CsgD family transcriptional regulator
MAEFLTSEADADRRAWHLARAATGFDDALADLLEASADRALSRGGTASAVDRWQWAAEFSTADARRCRRLLMAAQTAFQAAQPERARHLLSTARVLATSPREHGEITSLDGCIELRNGSPEAAYDLLLRGARQLAPHDPRAALEALVLAGEAATFLGDPRRTSEVGGLADELRITADPDDLTMVDLLVGLGKLFEGNWSDGSEILARVVDRSVGGTQYGQVLRSGRAAMYLGRLVEARELYARAAAQARSSGAAGQLTPMLDRLAYIELLLNRLQDSEAHALEGLRLAGDLGLDAGVAVTSLATVHAYRGEGPACRARVAQADEVAAARQLRMIGAAGHWALGLLELGAGRPREALSALLVVASEAQGHPGILRWATADLVEAAVRSGKPETCEPAVARLEEWAAASGLPVPSATLARCRGLLSSGETSIGFFESALTLDAGATRPLERARIELLLGETLRRGRHRVRARDHLRRALDAFERLGAAPWADRARAELRATGETTRRKDASAFEHLTPQELQIARYAADGESNAEIAAKLFLSRRTVEYHLGKVYTKVGVISRRELAGTALASR